MKGFFKVSVPIKMLLDRSTVIVCVVTSVNVPITIIFCLLLDAQLLLF